jgi:UDP-N-acetylglucosamine 2-epimerase (non-hydrolysing)
MSDEIKVLSVVGARPNFMKIAPFIRAISKHNDSPQATVSIEHILVHTGQHYDYQMSQAFFQDLEIPRPDYHLDVGSGSHAVQTGKVMIALEKVLLEERPWLVVVVGDVNSTLAAAICAVKLHILVAHIESGLRSFDRAMPEEINRLLTDAISDYLFTPSPDADENLLREGIPREKIFLVGDIMVDSLLHNRSRAEKSTIVRELGLLDGSGNKISPYALLTLHRPSNVDSEVVLSGIVQALTEVANSLPVIFPVHPRTRGRLQEFGLAHHFKLLKRDESRAGSIDRGGIYLLEPLGYLDFLKLEMNASLVLTDSGGIQEEATVLDVPCLTLRNTTERPVTITHGTNTLVWNDSRLIIEETRRILAGKGKKGSSPELWDGRTAERIVGVLVDRAAKRSG